MMKTSTNPNAFALDEKRTLAVVDPVCGRRIELDRVATQEDHEGWAYFFCSHRCHQRFATDPGRFAEPRSLQKDGEAS